MSHALLDFIIVLVTYKYFIWPLLTQKRCCEFCHTKHIMGLTLTGAYNTRQLQIVIINSILVVLSILAVVLRIWARRLQGLSLFIEDYLSIIALVRNLAVPSDEDRLICLKALALAVNALLFQSDCFSLAPISR